MWMLFSPWSGVLENIFGTRNVMFYGTFGGSKPLVFRFDGSLVRGGAFGPRKILKLGMREFNASVTSGAWAN